MDLKEQENLSLGMEGEQMYALAKRLFPICRSITGDGVRTTLSILKEFLPELMIREIPSGTKCFDWEIPNEWNIRDAYIKNSHGEKVVSFQDSNLHVVGYSLPVNQTMTYQELDNHLYSLPEKPDTIPYITSYYEPKWGFCLTERKRENLNKNDKYHVVIDSDLKPGHLTYGELILKGKSNEEIFLSTYVCHPSLGNNELSGPIVTTWLAQFIKNMNCHYTYRIIFIPETIGSICYLSQHYKVMQKNVMAGFNVTCIGDNNSYSYLPSRNGNTLSDRVALHVLENYVESFKKYSFLDRGSDERQYCSPGIDLPIATIMRSKYGEYTQYHTSDDSLSYISAEGLLGGLAVLKRAITILEHNFRPVPLVLCEPQLGKRNLCPNLSFYREGHRNSDLDFTQLVLDLLAYADGNNTLLDIADIIKAPFFEVLSAANQLIQHNLIKKANMFSETHQVDLLGEKNVTNS